MFGVLKKAYARISNYEYCIGVRRIKDDDDYLFNSSVKPEFVWLKSTAKEWYADPMLFEYKDKFYIFFELYDNKKQKGCIAYVEILEDGSLTTPTRVIEEEYHMSFPFIFVNGNDIFMIPETSSTSSIKIFRCLEFPTKWTIYQSYENIYDTVDAVLLSVDNSGGRFIASKEKPDYRLKSKLVVTDYVFDTDLRINFDNMKFIHSDYRFGDRNGGATFQYQGKFYRIAQVSTKDIYGESLRIYEIINHSVAGYQERLIKSINIEDYEKNYPIGYVPYGTHTYSVSDHYEAVDIVACKFRMNVFVHKIWDKFGIKKNRV